MATATMKGNLAAAEELGVPESTIRYWRSKPEFANLHEKTREDVAGEFWTTVQIGLERIAELIPKTEDLQKVATAVGILYDKHALLTGGATGRTESRELNDLPDSSYVDAIREFEAIARSRSESPAPTAEDPPAG